MRTIIALLLAAIVSTAQAGSITFTVKETGFADATKVYAISDADLVRVRAAYQIAANASVNHPATRVEVLLFWLQQLINSTTQQVSSSENQAAIQAIPPNVPINAQ